MNSRLSIRCFRKIIKRKRKRDSRIKGDRVCSRRGLNVNARNNLFESILSFRPMYPELLPGAILFPDDKLYDEAKCTLIKYTEERREGREED